MTPNVHVQKLVRTSFLRGIFGGFMLGIAAGAIIWGSPPAEATPCLFQGDWNCQGDPQWNGQQQQTWDIPGVYGGRTSNPVMCNPVSMECNEWTH